MPQATFVLHGDLQDFVARERRGVPLRWTFAPRASVKDTLEAIGVPHPEVDLIVAEGRALTFPEPAPEDVQVDVFPRGEGPEGPGPRLIPRIEGAPAFLLDGHLGRLAAALRMLGFDTAWQADCDDEVLAARSRDEGRVLLTRDLGLLKRGAVSQGAFVRATSPHAQAHEAVRRFALAQHARPFTRCLRCNGLLQEVPKAEVEAQVPPRVRERQQRFWRCARCGHLFWPGTHHERMSSLAEELLRTGKS